MGLRGLRARCRIVGGMTTSGHSAMSRAMSCSAMLRVGMSRGGGHPPGGPTAVPRARGLGGADTAPATSVSRTRSTMCRTLCQCCRHFTEQKRSRRVPWIGSPHVAHAPTSRLRCDASARAWSAFWIVMLTLYRVKPRWAKGSAGVEASARGACSSNGSGSRGLLGVCVPSGSAA
jgi:hypothetical protein